MSNRQHIRLWIGLRGATIGTTLADMTLNTRTPFTRKAALLAKMTVSELVGPRFERIFHGIYISADVEVTVAVRAKAALLVAPQGSYVSHHTAVLLWGGWAPPTSETHISTPYPRSRSERKGIVAHVGTADLELRRRSGVVVAPAPQAFLELAAAGVSLVDLVIAGDSLVRASAATPADLVDAADAWTGRRRRLAQRAAGLVRKGVDSVMESRVRLLLVLAGLPEPAVNHIIRWQDGAWRRRIEMCYLGLKIAVEYDGKQHLDTLQRRTDLRRREELERDGWLFIVLVSDDVYIEPAVTVDRVRAALAERGASQRRRRLSPEWNRSFPSRPAAA